MFVAVMGRRAFGHTVAVIRRVGPIGAVAVQFRTEEPGEQRFCQDQRLKQPMGLPFSEWADCKVQSLAAYESRSYLTKITADRPGVTSDFGGRRRGLSFKTASLPWPLATNQHSILV